MAKHNSRKSQALAAIGALYAPAALASGDMRVLLPPFASLVASALYLSFIVAYIGVPRQRNVLLAVLAVSTAVAWAVLFTWQDISAWPAYAAVVVGVPALSLAGAMLALARFSK
jgi:hypothetical protein